MSYQRELTTFKQGNQLSTCGKYNLQDLSDMFSQTEIDGAEEYTELEDILKLGKKQYILVLFLQY